MIFFGKCTQFEAWLELVCSNSLVPLYLLLIHLFVQIDHTTKAKLHTFSNHFLRLTFFVLSHLLSAEQIQHRIIRFAAIVWFNRQSSTFHKSKENPMKSFEVNLIIAKKWKKLYHRREKVNRASETSPGPCKSCWYIQKKLYISEKEWMRNSIHNRFCAHIWVLCCARHGPHLCIQAYTMLLHRLHR